MKEPHKTNLHKSSTRRIFLYCLISFVTISLMGTAGFFWYMNNWQRQKLQETFEHIDHIFTPTIVSSLWITDYESVRKQIEGLSDFHYIDRIEIQQNKEEKPIVAGTVDSTSLDKVQRELTYSYKGETRRIGTMNLYVNRNAMWETILSDAFTALFLQLLLSLLLSAVIAGAFYFAIGRHLCRFANFLKEDDPAKTDVTFSLGPHASRADELALVIDHFNNTRQKMSKNILEIQKWRDLMEYLIRYDPNAIAVYDKNMRYIFVSRKYIEDYKLSGEDIIGKTCYEVFPELHHKWKSVHSRVLSGEEAEMKDDIMFHRDGSRDYINWQYRPLENVDGTIDGIIYYSEITTERKKMERALYIEKEQFRTTLFSVGDGIISTDNLGKVVLMNRVAEELTGWSFHEAVGKSMETIFNIINEDTMLSCDNPVQKVLENREIMELADQTMLISKTGNSISIEDSAAPIVDQEGNITGVVLVFRDCTYKRKKQKEIEYLSYHDQLTGLYNRRFFDEELRRLDVKRNLPLTLVMMDVNGLKLLNDAFGHTAGDRLLQKVSEVLSRGLRADDIVARIGGDEFAILFPQTDSELAGRIMERIICAMKMEKVEEIPLSVSYGFKTKKNEDESTEKVFDIAEDLMYQNKIYEKSSFHNQSVKLILQTLYATSPAEQEHSKRVSEISEKIGEAMGLGLAERNELFTAGNLHDIGKVGIRKYILDKQEPLEEDEWEEIKRHPEVSYKILSTLNEYAPLAEIILSHHERWDGKGYPRGLRGEDIPLDARIIAVADAYDAMISERAYRDAMSTEEALEELTRCSGTQFDPDVVNAFTKHVMPSTQVFDTASMNNSEARSN